MDINIKENVSTKYLILLMLFAYSFSILIRMIWVYQFSGIDNFSWNNQLMINTNDGYFFASWVQAIIDGIHQYNPRVETDIFKHATVFVTVLAVKLGVSLESAILYMPAIISSLVVVPIILIARIYNLTIFGFFASLIASIAWSYYNRTMIGYYDTDMFSAMAPMFILYFLIKLIEENSIKNIIYASIMLSLYPFLYDQGQTIVYAMGLMYMGYMVVFHRKDKFTYKSIILLSIALVPMYIGLKIILFGIVFIVLNKKDFELKVLIISSFISVFLFLIFGDVIGIVLAKIFDYTIRGTNQDGLHFFGVNQTVREAGKIPFEVMANRISGSEIGLLASILGYILMVVRYKPMVLALPLIGIGVFSLVGGLRFTVYAVPVAAMGAVYLFYIIGSFIKNTKVRYVVITFLTIIMLYPNIKHIIGYKVPTVFTKQEVIVLDKLKNISSPKDYTLTWWDYGYPVWYYSDTNTLIDGGKHNNDNFIISKILTTTSQVQSANLSRLAVEVYAEDNKTVADKIFKNKQKDQLDPNKFLSDLKQKDYKLPKKTRDIYLYLPNRMLNILPTVNVFSNLNLLNGDKYRNHLFYQSKRFQDRKDVVDLGNHIQILKNKGSVKLGNRVVSINNFIVTSYDAKMNLKKNIQVVDPTSNINVIYMKNYGTFLILDNEMFNSVYIQLFVLENYNKDLFEPVILSPLAKVYKLKI